MQFTIHFLQKRITFYILIVSLNVVLPLFITTVLYIIVCHKLWSREVPGEGTSQNQRQAKAMKTAKKVTRMMITVVVLYELCFFPVFVVSGLYHFGYEKAFAYSDTHRYVTYCH